MKLLTQSPRSVCLFVNDAGSRTHHVRWKAGLLAAAGISTALGASACGSVDSVPVERVAEQRSALTTLPARIVARGLGGAGAIAQVGGFLTGSPIHDRPAFAPFSQPGQVLDPKRLLVATVSNYGALRGRTDQPEGSVISLDPAAANLVVPAFAAAGGQAVTTDGLVRLYTANAPAFLNSINNPAAATANEVAATLPTGISLNNGNGRPWVSNAPAGQSGKGSIAVLDPNGTPLAGAPDPTAGGVFTGNETNRSASSTHGLTFAATGTAIITKSSDLTGRAVFAVVEADGSVVQVHVQKGVDGLAPPGTVTPLPHLTAADMASADAHTVARHGVVFNWVPTRTLFIADPQINKLVALDLTEDGTLFAATSRLLSSSSFDWPIDIAPTAREVASANFASNTTLGGGSDMYVLNRGNNTILRMSITGQLIGTRQITSSLVGFRVNGIAVSEDGQKVWVTANLPSQEGVVLEMDGFGAPAATAQLVPQAIAGGAQTMASIGANLFSHTFTLAEGVGPLFNATSCLGCHSSPFAGGMGVTAAQTEQLFARIKGNGNYDPMSSQAGPTARAHSITELGGSCGVSGAVPPPANIISLRNTMTLRGNGLLDTILLGDVLKNMALEPAAVRGRPNILADGRWGKFGWKANVATIIDFMGEAFRTEMGVLNPLQPADLINGCNANGNSPEVDGLPLQATAAFLNTLDPPVPTSACLASAGATQFATVGCAGCHAPTLPGRATQIRLYSDLLLHDMGPALADGMQQGVSTGSEWRTMPLWRVAERAKLLHDGRSTTIADAINQHGGQAATARGAFFALDAAGQQAVLDFLACL